MPPESPPAKRRRTSSPPPPPRRASPTLHRPSHSPEAPRPRRKNPLEGFDDEQELPHERDERERDEALLARTTAAAAAGEGGGDGDGDDDEEHCAICLSPIENKTVVYPCHHGQFCWNCIRAWTDQSRKCPLCLGPIEHLIHNIRSPKDYQVHYLLPLHTLASTSSAALDPLPPRGNRPPRVNEALPRHALYGRSRLALTARFGGEDEATWRERQAERELERRRYIYREGLYAKHVASNRYTGFKPFSPQTFASNSELKAKVIKFIRRELQVFPAVDVAFLTTYLVSIASQLDLRSSAAIRLISDFLSEQDAQHLVHEITTFARSPFKALDGYDRFVQYGRPHRDVPKALELEALVLEPEDLQRDAPRFEAHMRRRQAEDAAAERARPRPPPPMARGLPPRPAAVPVSRAAHEQPRRRAAPFSSTTSRGVVRVAAPLERGSAQPSPWSAVASARARLARPRRAVHGRARGRSRSRSRSRDSRYRSSSPRDRRRSRSLSRSRSRSPSRSRSRSALSPGARSYRRSPSPAHSRGERGSSSRSRTLQADSRSPSRSRSPPAASRGHSRSLTPLRRTASATPPPPDAADDSGATSLVGPSSSSAPSRRPATPATVASARPTLSIFGAARRLLGNGRVVTLSEDGRASLHAAPAASAGKGKGKGRAVEVPGQEPYDAVPRARPASPAGKTLLARLGGVGPSSSPSPAGGDAPSSSSTSAAAAPAASTPAEPSALAKAPADSAQSLRAKLQARLTAEYRQALASRAGASPSAGAAAATDLRGLLQARLTAEKALAYEELTRARAQASVAASVSAPVVATGGPTTFSQATRDLLLARLEEERLLAEEEGAAVAMGMGMGAGAGIGMAGFEDAGHDVDYGYDYSLSQDTFDERAPSNSAAPAISPPSPPPPAGAPSPAKSEMALKAALLSKRKAAVEAELQRRSGELKERLMRQKLLAKRKAAATAAAEKAAQAGEGGPP
ncbi:hypothetical protein DMC30DRAFT_351654 [Rhodotorula diobovata]|uniref:RING-type E3 ubiquitin transferase n=1 Tax=Rhodotorula diobovata TaxID=5288 RepID=A0A5C5FV96_9BASI|nr:hypothetical protein DMC30DRAFT_351654 [Rhodotorula diobovata]